MYIGHAALGTKMYPGLYAPGTRGRADLGVGERYDGTLLEVNFPSFDVNNVLVFIIMTKVRPFNLITAEFNVWRQAVNYI